MSISVVFLLANLLIFSEEPAVPAEKVGVHVAF